MCVCVGGGVYPEWGVVVLLKALLLKQSHAHCHFDLTFIKLILITLQSLPDASLITFPKLVL